MLNTDAQVCVVIVNWNGREDTLACLRSVSAAPEAGRIVVVDNGSEDDSVAAIRQEFPGAVVLEMGSNIGFAAANNAGAEFYLRETAVPYLLLLNNDAFLEADTLQRLTHAMADQANVGIAAPKTYYYPPPPVRLWYAGGAIDWKQGSCEHWGFGGLDRGQYDAAKRVTFAPGAALLIRRALVQSIGLFDDRYFMFEEDVDLSIRAVKAGFGILYLPEAVVWHRVGRSADKRGNAFIWYHLVRNRLYTMHKHASRTQWLQFLLYFPILWLWKAVYYSAHGQFDVARAMVRGCSDYRAGRMGWTLAPDRSSRPDVLS